MMAYQSENNVSFEELFDIMGNGSYFRVEVKIAMTEPAGVAQLSSA